MKKYVAVNLKDNELFMLAGTYSNGECVIEHYHNDVFQSAGKAMDYVADSCLGDKYAFVFPAAEFKVAEVGLNENTFTVDQKKTFGEKVSECCSLIVSAEYEDEYSGRAKKIMNRAGIHNKYLLYLRTLFAPRKVDIVDFPDSALSYLTYPGETVIAPHIVASIDKGQLVIRLYVGRIMLAKVSGKEAFLDMEKALVFHRIKKVKRLFSTEAVESMYKEELNKLVKSHLTGFKRYSQTTQKPPHRLNHLNIDDDENWLICFAELDRLIRYNEGDNND